jgi:hypothetical protein
MTQHVASMWPHIAQRRLLPAGIELDDTDDR